MPNGQPASIFLTATPINLHQQDLLNLRALAPEISGTCRTSSCAWSRTRSIQHRRVRGPDGAWRERPPAERAACRAAPDGPRAIPHAAARLRAPVRAASPGPLAAARHRAGEAILADLNTLSTVITRTKKVEVDDRKAKRTEDRQESTGLEAEKDFYDHYVAWCQRPGAAHRHARCTSRCRCRCDLRAPACRWPAAQSSTPFLRHHFGRRFRRQSERPEPHPDLVGRAERLPGTSIPSSTSRRVLHGLHSQGKRRSSSHIPRPTLAYLAGRLGEDFRVAVMHGGVSRGTAPQDHGRFRAGGYDFVLANRVASEGLDFEFCSAVINYDLPWNPMEIEQRIGRIDRIGRKEEAILLVNFVNEARSTNDPHRLLDRIGIFESSIGALEPIIADMRRRSFRPAFDFTLSARATRTETPRGYSTAIEEQQAGVQGRSDASSALLVSNDVDVAGLEDDLVRTGQSSPARTGADDRRLGSSRRRLGRDLRTVRHDRRTSRQPLRWRRGCTSSAKSNQRTRTSEISAVTAFFVGTSCRCSLRSTRNSPGTSAGGVLSMRQVRSPWPQQPSQATDRRGSDRCKSAHRKRMSYLAFMLRY